MAMDDFYIDQKGLAAYFELQWLDKLRDDGVKERLHSKSRSVPDSFVSCDYSKAVACFIRDAFERASISPETILEVGPALGRNCYELIKHSADIKSITVVEPSHRLLSNFKQILVDGNGCDFTYINSVNKIGSFHFRTASISRECSHIEFCLIEAPFERGVVEEKYDLAICLNVLDQCESPNDVVNALKEATAINGILVLSCSYQWNKKHIKNELEAVDDINDYFGVGWEKLSEDDNEYRIRFNERYSLLFLAHIVAYRKVRV